MLSKLKREFGRGGGRGLGMREEGSIDPLRCGTDKYKKGIVDEVFESSRGGESDSSI